MGEQNEYTRTNIVEMEDGSFEEIIEDQSSLKSSVQAEFKAKMLEEEQKEQEVENRKEKAVIILSGGMDSGTLLFDLKRKYNVFAITFDYGQKHRKEIFAAKALCLKTKPKTPHQVMNLSGLRGLLKNSSSLLNNSIKVPDGHYEDETMKSTVVPNRNMIMLSIAIGYAIDL
jgi:NH3-dependent NAD+ synthetase